MDGTLLDPLERVSARTAAVVRRVVAADVPFVLVTGRPPRWVPPVAEAAGVTGYAVCGNGAALYDIDADRVLWQRTLDPVLLRDVTRAIDEALPGCRVATERVDVGGDGRPSRRFLSEPGYQHPWWDPEHSATSRDQVLGHAALKLLIRHDNTTSEEMAEIASAVLDGAVNFTFSSRAGLLEISARGVTKATGLADVADRLGVAAADVVAFGDMSNDVPMLHWAGHGVAMGNAHPDALAAADEVTSSNAEDGLALVLERWF